MQTGQSFPRSILIVEDEELLAEAIKIKLEEQGYKTLTARTVDQAYDYLREIGPVGAIWLDHYLPGKMGVELLKLVRRTQEWKDIPVFLVTNTVENETVNQYLKLGISQYYTKVLTPLEKIVTMITAQLQNFSK